MRAPARDDLLDAGLASLAAGVHLAMAAQAGYFPPELDFSALFVVVPVLLAVVAAVAVLVRGERRPLLVAAVYTSMMVLFTLPAGFLGLSWLPTAVLLTVTVLRPRLSSAPSAAG